MSMQQRRRRAAASLRPSTAYNVPTARVFHQGTVQLRVCRVCGVCDGGVWSEGLSVPIGVSEGGGANVNDDSWKKK